MKENKINVKSDFDKFIKTNVNGIEKNDPYYRWNVEVTKEQLKNKAQIVYDMVRKNLGDELVDEVLDAVNQVTEKNK